ncbi:MAG: hypothetical protein Q7S81_00505 [bacterium]|nr:hypothetical protein [bacterium]
MTIIEPNKSKYSYNSAVLLMSLSLACLAFSNIYIYNKNVTLKQSISEGTKNLQELQVVNAEFKNKLYKMTDLSNLNDVIKSNNLVKDKSPKYFETKSLAVN